MSLDIAGLIPHAGAMCLLASVALVGGRHRVPRHLPPRPGQPAAPGRAAAGVCGIEYALQAAAVHGALRGGAPQPPGYLAACA